MRKWISIILALVFYILGRIFFSSYSSPLSWLFTLVLFVYGFRWVYLFLADKIMPMYVNGGPMYPGDKKARIPRLIHFICGVLICIGASVS